MPLSPYQKERLRELELEHGGVAFVSDKICKTAKRTLVIGVGGLGCETLDVLKKKYNRMFDEEARVYFRALDADFKDLQDLKHLEDEEKILMYDPSCPELLHAATTPAYLKTWLNCSLYGAIDTVFYSHTRQIGRFLLANHIVYPKVYNKLGELINQMIHCVSGEGEVQVIFITGVSGATGGATVIDLAYLVHNIFYNLGWMNYSMTGYVYTPDTQFSVQGVLGNPSIRQELQKNGYATLKEIDYFMNLQEKHEEYRLDVGSHQIVSQKNVFGNCILVSGIMEDGTYMRLNDNIDRVTEHLIDMLTESHMPWGGLFTDVIMKPNTTGHAAWLGAHEARRHFHRYATYKYQVLAYGSITVPKDQLLAYCVNKIYERVLREFQNLSLVNKDMMRVVYERTNIIAVEPFTAYACRVNPNNVINNDIYLDPIYTKAMIRQNPMVAYEDARAEAETEKAKVNAGFQQMLEQSLVHMLKEQVDQIFATYGPFVALKAIEHKHTEVLGEGPSDPFPGIIEQLQLLANQFIERANEANAKYDRQAITNAADSASGLLSGNAARQEYVNLCCDMAVSTVFDTHLYSVIAEALHGVAHKLMEYSQDELGNYVELLDEVRDILHRDGMYFAEKKEEDIFGKFPSGHIKIQRYLDDLVSCVNVNDLTKTYVHEMYESQSVEKFDMVSSIRRLMDDCLIKYNMKQDVVEKLLAVACSEQGYTVTTLHEMWRDNNPGSVKMQLLDSASGVIYRELGMRARSMVYTWGMPLAEFETHKFMTVSMETPIVSNLLTMRGNMANIITGQTISGQRFNLTIQHLNLPLYVIRGMEECNDVYVERPSEGRHLDERTGNWGCFPNPLTIDAVGMELEHRGRTEDIIRYPDYHILMDVVKKVQDGVGKYKYIETAIDAFGITRMYLQEIASPAMEMDEIKKILREELLRNPRLEIIDFMRQVGFQFHSVEVSKGNTDIDMGLLDFADASPHDLEMKYSDLPIRVPDIYKWIRCNMRYMKILDDNTKIFEELSSVTECVLKYHEDIRAFANILRADLLTPDEHLLRHWKYGKGKNAIRASLAECEPFEMRFYLYHLFAEFSNMEEEQRDNLETLTEYLLDNGQEVDNDGVLEHIRWALEEELQIPGAKDRINLEARDCGVSENYIVTDKLEDKGNPYEVLHEFYVSMKFYL